ncbi:Uncharacterized protein Adt_13325 [Abeliophyllum distichum]|uniref:Selenoprotein H n=1 Tax=Abeliophyllum distichum TaxID=126358 RepID=A0ABD1TWG5_9LAMI
MAPKKRRNDIGSSSAAATATTRVTRSSSLLAKTTNPPAAAAVEPEPPKKKKAKTTTSTEKKAKGPPVPPQPAEQEPVKNGLEKGLEGVNVVVNPEKPRRGCFEIREEGGDIFVSLLDMKRPFTPMKALDMEKVISDIIEKIE